MPGRVSASNVETTLTCDEPAAPPPPPRSAALPQITAWTPADAGAGGSEAPAGGGSLAASELVQGLSARSVLAQVDTLLSSRLPANLGVTSGDASVALGLIASLPQAEQREVLTTLGRDRRLTVLVEKLPAEEGARLLEVALTSGLVSERPAQPAAPRTPQPPARPALLDNQPSLPSALRELVHRENRQRAQAYAAQFDAYVGAYCEGVRQATSPAALRALGPVSTPPALPEPGLTADDQRLRRWNMDLVGTSPGLERATRAVSDRISDFRNEVHAGGFSLGLDLAVKATLSKPAVVVPSAHDLPEGAPSVPVLGGPLTMGVGIGKTVSTSVTDDGRLFAPKVKDKAELQLKKGKAGLSAEVSPEGQVAAVKGSLGDHSVELNREGKMTFSTKVDGVSLGTFADPRAGAMGASVGLEETAEFDQLKLGVSGKVSVTAQGIRREYYQDIGGRQGGVFGPMPELDTGVAWSALPKERQQWYARQGFTQAHWPGTAG